MKIKFKIILACALLSSLAIILSSSIIGYESLAMSDKALESRVHQQLTSVRDLKKKQIEDYFEQMREQLVTLASSPVVKQASIDFSRIFKGFKEESPQKANYDALKNWYQDVFTSKFNALNTGQSERDKAEDISALFEDLSQPAKYFQNMMLLGNQKPVKASEKNYLAYHAKYHPWLEQLKVTFGFYDIFIIEPQNGQIIYSTEKEAEFATSLEAGPFKHSSLAQAYLKAKGLEEGKTILIDFKPYIPSYNTPASFIATPIKQGDRLLGVLAFQVPIKEINKIMTMDGNWEDAGLGETGESYLVGEDLTLRSESRFLLQDPDAYFSSLKLIDISSSVQANIKAYKSGISLHPIKTESARLALSNQKGLVSLVDYRNHPVYSAYSPVDIEGVNWAILSEIDQSEALSDQTKLHQSLLKLGLITTVILLALAVALGWFFGSYIAKPIDSFIRHIKHITRNKNLTIQYESSTQDEFASLGQELNQFTSDLCGFFSSLKSTSQSLSNTSVEMTQNAHDTKSFAAQQSSENNSVATAATELEASLSQVASLTDDASNRTRDTQSKCEEANLVVEQAKAEMEQLAEKMQLTTETMGKLENESHTISDVLNVIQTIAEQTNLLALNAAIEAARAGEQGRGFAVVADEVRSLAAKTADSTEEIRLKIETLQTETNTAVTAVQNSQQHTQSSISKVDEAVNSIRFVSDQIHTVNDMSTQIATAADEQSKVTGEISQNVNRINDMSSDILQKTADIQSSSEQLNAISEKINQEIAKFKTA